MDRERQLEGSQILSTREVPVRVKNLQERIVELLFRRVIREIALGDAVEEGKVGRGVFLRGGLASVGFSSAMERRGQCDFQPTYSSSSRYGGAPNAACNATFTEVALACRAAKDAAARSRPTRHLSD